VRWQNGVLRILPGLDLLSLLVRAPQVWRRHARAAAALLGGAALGAFPQMAAWKAIYGMWILPYPPQGTDFLRFSHPFVLETLFSSRHGLLSWTPLVWLGYLGFLPLLLRRRRLALPLVAPLLLMSYVNFCVADWWGGASFSNRRFDSLLPLYALGFAAALEVGRALLGRRPALVLAALFAFLTLWNGALAEEVRRNLVPRDDTVAFPRLAGQAAELVSDAVGFPTTWPASWLFAWRHDLSPARYDLLVGRYLFYRQNSVGERIRLADPEHAFLLDDGWSRVVVRTGVRGRLLRGRARVFAPLDVPEPLALRFLAASDTPGAEVQVAVNGRVLGSFSPTARLDDYTLSSGASFWHRELNEIRLQSESEVFLSEAHVLRRRR
jgi:hypothetical protein